MYRNCFKDDNNFKFFDNSGQFRAFFINNSNLSGYKIFSKRQVFPRHRRRNNLVHEVCCYSDKNWYINSELLSILLSIPDSFCSKTAFVSFLSKLDDTFFPCGNFGCRKTFVSNFLTLCVVPKLSFGQRVPLALLADLGYEKKVLRAETRFATLERYRKKYKKSEFFVIPVGQIVVS